MNNPERTHLVDFLRGELVGPIRSAGSTYARNRYEVKGTGPFESHPSPDDYSAWLFWKPEGAGGDEEEILSVKGGRNPHRSYGIGVLYAEPAGNRTSEPSSDDDAENGDTSDVGVVIRDTDASVDGDEDEAPSPLELSQRSTASDDDLEINSSDTRRPSSIAISFCADLKEDGLITVSFPRSKRMSWQQQDDAPFPLNGVYERFQLRLGKLEGRDADSTIPAYRRRPAVARDAALSFSRKELAERSLKKPIPKADGVREELKLEVQAYTRPHPFQKGAILVTVVMRNRSDHDDRDLALFQSCFEVRVENGTFLPYPESPRPPETMDRDEQTMELLYRNTGCWAIGHGCAAAWDDSSNDAPSSLTADVMPAVELPSMTPDIELDGKPIKVSMLELAKLPESEAAVRGAWPVLESLVEGYSNWITTKKSEIAILPERLRDVANQHIVICSKALARMRDGLKLLRSDADTHLAFRWANEAMLLQQIAGKQIAHREIRWDGKVVPIGEHVDPLQILNNGTVKSDLGQWRAFQIAFLLMSLCGMVEPQSHERELVDLVWFPTGGGKTEAYLGVAAFQMFHQRLLMKKEDGQSLPSRDGTNVLMRYTLRMLTTDQFQRAAGLICGMEAMRRKYSIFGAPFRLGLWLGSGGTPNRIDSAKKAIGWFTRNKGRDTGNPLVLTECPWCRTSIGRVQVDNEFKLAGIIKDNASMHCPDHDCLFHDDRAGLPVDVIDECIYNNRPSLVIGTADKFAMLAYEPKAGALFGRTTERQGREARVVRSHRPPSLIIQDELHLISGPLGTLFGLYETVISDLCTYKNGNRSEPPKVIASTATVRGAEQQVKSLFAREATALFPPPGLDIADSFFGRYARSDDGALESGRLYVGIHALYGSLQTTQARTYAALLARASTFDNDRKDPWWTLLAYYNSMRELAGARMLFDSDIQSRLRHLSDREKLPKRHLNVEELSSRLTQAQIVALKNKLSDEVVTGEEKERVDACLSSNIIEVGVDIDRLSLMAVVGQPKSTASYIQATGRVGRRWWQRPGLILTLLNPFKSRDTSHYEQFHTYHRRLYERVEPTSATPFSLAAIQRGLVGAVIAHIRQQVDCKNPDYDRYQSILDKTLALFSVRCESTGMAGDDLERSLEELNVCFEHFQRNWRFFKPEKWFDWHQPENERLLMLVPGKYASGNQMHQGFTVPTSLRDVDTQAELAFDFFQQDWIQA